jgi:hypothetical protein
VKYKAIDMDCAYCGAVPGVECSHVVRVAAAFNRSNGKPYEFARVDTPDPEPNPSGELRTYEVTIEQVTHYYVEVQADSEAAAVKQVERELEWSTVDEITRHNEVLGDTVTAELVRRPA